MTIDREKLLTMFIRYELPVFAEFVSVGWMQDIVAWYIRRKVSKKLDRYNKRIERDELIKNLMAL